MNEWKRVRRLALCACTFAAILGVASAGSALAQDHGNHSQEETALPVDALLEGFWEGQIIYAKAEIELDFSVELAPDAEGALVGSIDIPSQKMKFYPLTAVKTDGRKLSFDFYRDSERTKNAHFLFEGELSEDGGSMEGIFTGWYDDEGRNKVPFVLNRAGEAFGDRPDPEPSPLTLLSDDSRELKQKFNEDRDNPRLVLLLSPT